MFPPQKNTGKKCVLMKASAGGFISRASPESEKQHRYSVFFADLCWNVDAHTIFSSETTHPLHQHSWKSFPFLWNIIYIYEYKITSLRWFYFLPAVRLIECLQWPSQVTVEYLPSSVPSYFCVCPAVRNDPRESPAFAAALTSPWTPFIKIPPRVCAAPEAEEDEADGTARIFQPSLGGAAANEPAIKM